MSQRSEWVTTRRFVAVSESGQRYDIVEQQQITTVVYLDGHSDRAAGAIRLSAGPRQPVNRDSDGTMTLAATGEKLTPI